MLRLVCVCVLESGSQMNMLGVFLHVFGDALGSVVVIVSALVIKFVDADWVYRLDPAMRYVDHCSLLLPFQIVSSMRRST